MFAFGVIFAYLLQTKITIYHYAKYFFQNQKRNRIIHFYRF